MDGRNIAKGTMPPTMNDTGMSDILTTPLVFTIFKDVHALTLWRETDTPQGIAERIRDRTARTKQALPLIKLATFGAKITAKGSYRTDENMLGITGVEVDYDGGLIAFDEAVERLTKAGIAGIAYTSPSHTPEAPRWRVLAPLSRPAEPKARRALVGRINGIFDGALGKESFTASQAFYIGRLVDAPDFRCELIDEHPLDTLDALDWRAIFPPEPSRAGRPPARRSIPPRTSR